MIQIPPSWLCLYNRSFERQCARTCTVCASAPFSFYKQPLPTFSHLLRIVAIVLSPTPNYLTPAGFPSHHLRSPDFLHSNFVHNIPAGAFLSRIQTIGLTLPLLHLHHRYGDSLHVACNQCYIQPFVRHLGAAKCLKSLKISLNGCDNVFWTTNTCISLGGMRNFWDATVDLDRFEISVEGRSGLWEGAATFNESLGRNFDRLVLDIPTLESHIENKEYVLCYEVECSFVYKR